MTYEQWRITFQSSEQAARAAFSERERMQADSALLDRMRSECRVDVISTEVMSEGEVIAITITGVNKRDLLRQLAERLKQD